MQVQKVTLYQLTSALNVARVIDEQGNARESVRNTYHYALTHGMHSADSLGLGEEIIIRAGLVLFVEGRLVPTPALRILGELDDREALIALAVMLGVEITQARGLVTSGRRMQATSMLTDDPDTRVELGFAGEKRVIEECRQELTDLSHEDLVPRVQQVSLLSDALGYDIVGPTLYGATRLLEVKTTSGYSNETFRFFLTRNEYEVGRSESHWAVIACRASNGPRGNVEIVGWCRCLALLPYLPDDRNSHWTEALVSLPTSILSPGIPSAI